MKKNQLILVIVVAVLILAGGTTWYVLSSQKKTQQAPMMQDQTQQVLTLSPDDIGLTIDFRSDNKAMKFTVAKADGINSIEYQIAYSKDQKGQTVSEGLIGTVDMNPGDKTAGIGYREFGTCSSGVCRYDTVTSPITLTLKIVKSDGKIYQATKTVSLPQ